jgi:hypothetical protein
MTTSERLSLITKIITYNLKIVFANRFVYFFIAAILFYLVVIGIMLFTDAAPDTGAIFSVLMFPGILIIFYPVVYNIQSDKDARMLEIIFGVPDYRYKVYLVRFIIAVLLLFFSILLLAWFATFSVAYIPVFSVVYYLIFPLSFIACLAFLFSTLIKNGNGTAVVIVIIGLIFWFLSEPLKASKWNLFLNPFHVPDGVNQVVWDNTVSQNHLILLIGIVISLLWGMLNLQKREKFV